MRKALFVTLCFLLIVALAMVGAACNKVKDTVTDLVNGGGDAAPTTAPDAPTGITYDGEAVKWTAVSGATGYTVKINDGEERKVVSPLYIYNALNQSFDITVVATNAIGSSPEAKMTFNPLGTISQLAVDPNGYLSWEAINYATGYEVKIDNAADATVVTGTSLQITQVGRHSYQVRPVITGDPSYYSVFSAAKTVTLLEQVDAAQITYAEGFINWKFVNGATAYEVSVNGIPMAAPVNGTKCAFDPDNSDFSVTVKALGNNTDSFDGAVSETKNFVFMDTVSNVTIRDGILTWDPVDKATGYKLKLNGKELSQVVTGTSYDNITEGVTTTVQIMGTTSDAAVFSTWSPEKSVYLLPAPQLQWNSNYQTTEQETQSIFWDWTTTQDVGGFTVKVTDPSGATAYTNLPATQRGYTNEYSVPGDYVISLQANSNATNIYDSRYSKTITVKRLANVERAETDYITSDNADVTQGFTYKFKRNANAVGYHLYRGDVKVDETTTNQFVQAGFQDPDAIDEQVFDYKIVAKGRNVLTNGVVIIDSLYSQALSFSVTVLAVPHVEGMDGYVISYTAINHASGYRVNVGSNKFDSQGQALSVNISTIEAGSYATSVVAKGDGASYLPSNATTALTVTRLDPPSNVHIDTTEASEGVISYKEVPPASGYTIYFNNDDNHMPADSIENINQYISENGTNVYMTSDANFYNALGTEYFMTSKPSKTYNFIKLATPTFGNPAFSDSELLWNAPTNVNTNVYTPQYIVYLDDGSIYNGQRTGTRMDITKLVGGETYTFQVKAIGDGDKYINSVKSSTVTITKLKTPVVTLNDDNTAYKWKSVPSALSYAVYVDGTLVDTELHVSGEYYEYTPDTFNAIKDYQIKVYAIGDLGYTTIRSDACEITTTAKQLATPDFTFSYDKPYYQADGKITVTITRESPFAYGYSYTIAGATYFSKETSYSHCPGSPSSKDGYDMRVYAKGGLFEDINTYYLDSQSVGGNANYRIYLLTAPNADSMELSRDGILTWSAIANNLGYHVTVLKDGVQIVDIDHTSVSFEIEDFELGHTYTVSVYAKGNGTTRIQSATTEKEWQIKA